MAGEITNCYNTGSINGNGNGSKGCIAGDIMNYENMKNCYYNKETSNIEDNKATGKTTEEMKALSFVETLGTENWKQDINNINNGYPILKWQQ